MPSQAELAAALLQPTAAVPGRLPPDRFAVYRNNVVAGLIEALAVAYPAVAALVGERFFRAVAAAFVRERPPRSPVLIHYGAGFADFLAAFAPAQGVPFVADVARVERAWLEAFHAAEAVPTPIAVLARLSEETLSACRFRLHPSFRLVASRWPVVSLWAANTGRAEHAAVDLRRAETALVLRPGDRVLVSASSAPEASFFADLAAGRSFGESALAAAPGIDLGQALGRLFALGAVADIQLPSERSPSR